MATPNVEPKRNAPKSYPTKAGVLSFSSELAIAVMISGAPFENAIKVTAANAGLNFNFLHMLYIAHDMYLSAIMPMNIKDDNITTHAHTNLAYFITSIPKSIYSSSPCH